MRSMWREEHFGVDSQTRCFEVDIRGHHGKVWDYEQADYYMGSRKGRNKNIRRNSNGNITRLKNRRNGYQNS